MHLLRTAAAAAVSLALASVSAGQARLPLGETVERLKNLRVSSGSGPVNDLRLASGNLEVVLKSGRIASVRAGEEVVGLFFEGDGAFEYRSVDPIEFPVLDFNLKKGTSLKARPVEKGRSVGDGLSRLLWLGAGRALPGIEAEEGPALEASFQKHREHFGRAEIPPPSHLFAQQKIDAPGAALVRAEIAGREDLVYLFDEVLDHAESRTLLRKSESRDSEVRHSLFPTTLSDQPIGRDRRDPLTPRFLLTDVQIDVTASAGKDASLSVVETLLPQGDGQSVFRFDLLSVAYTVIGAGKLQPRAFRVAAVREGGGRPLAFDHGKGQLLVGFPAPLEAGQPAKMRVDIEGDFLIRPGGDNYWILGVEPWFPQPKLGEQHYTFGARVKVPKPFVPFAVGQTVSRRAEGNLNVIETRLERPIQFAVVLAGKYEFQEETRNGVTVRVATYALKNERAMKQLTNLAFGIIECYQNFLGPFPFPELNITEINDFGFGQAPPGVVFITKEAFNPYQGELNQLFSQGINERFAHEIAHQYWGHAVKMPSEEEQWLTESFAEYSAAVFLKVFKGKATYDQLVNRWRSRATFAREAAPIPLAGRVWVPEDPATRFAIRTGLIYDKGAYLLWALHQELGDETFLTFLKSYQRSFRFKFGTTKNVVGLLEFLTKKAYAPFFERNFWGTGMPGR